MVQKFRVSVWGIRWFKCFGGGGRSKQVAKARGYATCMVFGEGGRFVRDVGTRFRSHYLEILLV